MCVSPTGIGIHGCNSSQFPYCSWHWRLITSRFKRFYRRPCALRFGIVRFFAMPMTRCRNLSFALAAVLIFSSFAHARFTLEQVLSSPFPSQLRSAADANRIVWAVNQKGVRNIWIADTPAFVATPGD